MNNINIPPKDNSDHLKDSCNYSISITKTLLSFAAAGIAFLISILLSGRNFYPNYSVWIIMILLSISILLGLFFLMNVVGHINSFQNYNVNLPRFRWISIFQMSSFFIAIILLGGFALWHGTNESVKNDRSYIHIKSDEVEIRKFLTKDDSLSIRIENNQLNVTTGTDR